MKTLVVVLNYKTADLTNYLSGQLEFVKDDSYEVVIFDNSNDQAENQKLKLSNQNNIITSTSNKLFGGALNWAFAQMISQKNFSADCDSLLFLNSDILIHEKSFVSSLRRELYCNHFHIISPCILQPYLTQCFWKQMHNWGQNETRQVNWCDFTAVMFHLDFIKEVRQFPEELKYGWGIENLSGMICERNNWKIGVCDFIPIIHFVSRSIELNKHEPETNSYCRNAENNMFDYFRKNDLIGKFQQQRFYGEHYTFKKK